MSFRGPEAQGRQTWRTFLANHVRDLVSIDFLTVPTAGLRVLFVLVVLAHHRRRVLHFGVTEHPTAAWTAQQIVEAFPDDTAPAYLLRDRDQVYGDAFHHRVKGMGIAEILTAPHSPWQNPFAERLIGSVRQECLNHVLVLGERHLRRTLTRFFAYYHRARTHLSLAKDAPDGRPIEPPELGRVIAIPEVGGLHHRYVRRRGLSQPLQFATAGTPILQAARRPAAHTSPLSPVGPTDPNCHPLCFPSPLSRLSGRSLASRQTIGRHQPRRTRFWRRTGVSRRHGRSLVGAVRGRTLRWFSHGYLLRCMGQAYPDRRPGGYRDGLRPVLRVRAIVREVLAEAPRPCRLKRSRIQKSRELDHSRLTTPSSPRRGVRAGCARRSSGSRV